MEKTIIGNILSSIRAAEPLMFSQVSVKNIIYIHILFWLSELPLKYFLDRGTDWSIFSRMGIKLFPFEPPAVLPIITTRSCHTITWSILIWGCDATLSHEAAWSEVVMPYYHMKQLDLRLWCHIITWSSLIWGSDVILSHEAAWSEVVMSYYHMKQLDLRLWCHMLPCRKHIQIHLHE